MCCCRPAIQCSFPEPCPATPHTIYLHNTVGLIHVKKKTEGAHRSLTCHWKTKLVLQQQATGSQRRPMSLHYHSRNPPEVSTLAGSVFFESDEAKEREVSERERERRGEERYGQFGGWDLRVWLKGSQVAATVTSHDGQIVSCAHHTSQNEWCFCARLGKVSNVRISRCTEMAVTE